MTQKYKIIERASEFKSEALLVLSQMDQDYFPTPWSKEDWNNLFCMEQRFLLTIEDGGDILGFGLFNTVTADSFAHLLKFVVSPKARSIGVGKNLLNEAVRVLKERDIKKFFLEVEEYNTHAIKLYTGMGFKIVHQKKQFYSSGATALIMTLNI